MSSWNDPHLIELFTLDTPLIDVRSPLEFAEGAIPNSVNLPILNDQERVLVGTCYKHEGQEAAIQLGHRLVTPELKDERILAWMKYLKAHPQGKLFCFRGGLRSQISCQWLRDAGWEIYPMEGGYKRLRRFLLDWLELAPLPPLIRISGLTGAGKTQFLERFPASIDLEQLAQHRGSAFGGTGAQPSQITFENELALELIKKRHHRLLLVEDESAVIGRLTIPRRLFEHMRGSDLIILQASWEERIQNIYQHYVVGQQLAFFLGGLQRIKAKLSAALYQQIAQLMLEGFQTSSALEHHAPWIRLLLEHYYDPYYRKGLEKQKSCVIFEGDAQAVSDFLKDKFAGDI
jgi:tRNA 2-selenouridine synthase